MTPELWERLKPLYNAALDLPEHGRTGYIEQMCEGDADLERELRALIRANQSAANTLDPPLSAISVFENLRNAVLTPGTILSGRFRIVQHLGSGGMGDVYEAMDLQLEQGRIALKTLRPEIAGNAEALARFKAEVLLARKITGPNICRIHELYLTGSNHGGMPVAFLTMELLDGITLHDHIEAHSPLPVAEIRLLADQLCCALGCIHEAGIIHRDLKTRNVMLVPQAGAHKVVVMDFGLALISAPQAGDSTASHTGPVFVAGTPSYMAPEQFEGREAGPPTDIYALGLILYEMATGVQPFAAHTPLAAAIRRSQQPRFASSFRNELPPAWDDVIQRCLQFDPAKRFQSAAEVTDALKHPGKLVLRLGSNHRLTLPYNVLLAAGLVLAVVITATSWVVINNAGRRKLSPEAAHWYELGMTALREGSYLKATKLLTEVTQRDPTYAVAHAALADAWTELDYTETAQHEMLLASAPKEQRGLSDLDRRYIDAVRSTLIRDYSAAAQDYEAILDKDPANRKADGYVDLGRIYEKAGKMNETVASYEKAAQLNPDDPAPFLHLGILKSRLRQPEAASIAFNRAEVLYGSESDQDGLAEVEYQRGYAANQAGAFSQAKQHLEHSLQIAHEIPNIQMEVRSLSQLSSVADNQNAEDLALSLGQQALEESRKAGLEYWTTDALVRVGNAYMGKEDFKDAEPSLQEALHRAQQDGHPRLQAYAQLNLASLFDQQGKWNAQVETAKAALSYYEDYGFLNPADLCLVLIMRGELARADYTSALGAAQQLITTATRTQSWLLVAKGEEVIGDVYQETEQYPNALKHFEISSKLTGDGGIDGATQNLHRADLLWRLGRYVEADALIHALLEQPIHRADLTSSVIAVQAEAQASRGNYLAVTNAYENVKRSYPTQSLAGSDLQRATVIAELRLGQLQKARANLEQVVASAQADGRPLAKAEASLLQAEFDFYAKQYPEAVKSAESAQTFFQTKGLLESEAISLWLQAEAIQAMGDLNGAASLAQKSLDIFEHLEQSWGNPSAFNTYQMRTDRREILDRLHPLALRGAGGSTE